MTAVRSIITRAVRLLGAVAQGTPLPAGDAADGLAALNSMLEAWNINSLDVFTKNFDEYQLVPGQQVYTIGPTGNIAAAPQLRPTTIDRALLKVLQSTPNIELPIKMIEDQEWSEIAVKNLTSTYCTKMYSTGDFPNLSLYLWPIPTLANKLILWTWNQVTALADINTDLSLPPGYERAIIYNLAMELSAEYGLMPSPVVSQIAVDSLAQVKRINSIPLYLDCDPALLSPPAAFNWLTGK